MLKIKKNPLNNEKGISMIEVIPIIAVFVLLLNFSIGFFGVIHSGILSSIAARNYAFETFQFRSNLNYFRDNSDSTYFTYYSIGYRYHANISESHTEDYYMAAVRPIKFTDVKGVNDPAGNAEEHRKLASIQEGKLASDVGVSEGVSPVWIKTLYGMCMTATCGTQIRSAP
jgi:hypothetical protein